MDKSRAVGGWDLIGKSMCIMPIVQLLYNLLKSILFRKIMYFYETYLFLLRNFKYCDHKNFKLHY